MIRGLRRMLPAVVAVLLLTACGDGGETGTLPPTAGPTPTVSMEAAASPSATPVASSSPSLPVAASESLSPEEQAAVQAVVDYYAAFKESYEARDANILRSKSTPVCPCLEAVGTVQRAIDLGGRVEGGDLTVAELHQVSVSPETAAALVVADVMQAGGQVIGESGETLATIPENAPRRTEITLTRVDGHWLVARVDAA